MKALRILDSAESPLVLSQGALGAGRFPLLPLRPAPFFLHYR